MTRKAYISMVFSNIIEQDPTAAHETAFLRAEQAANFLESKNVAPWQEAAEFRVAMQQAQLAQQAAQQAATAPKAPEVLPDPQAPVSDQ